MRNKVAEYRRAAEQGDVRWQFDLGMMYMDGRNVERDPVEGMEWLRKAAEQGDAGAQNNLGSYLMRCKDVEPDYAEAYFWYSLAAKAEYYNCADEAAGHLTKKQIKEIDRRVKKWKPVVTEVPASPEAPAFVAPVNKADTYENTEDFDPISEVIDKTLVITKDTIRQLAALRKAEKFVNLPGVNIEDEKERLAYHLNGLIDKLIEGVSQNPSKLWVLKQFQAVLEATEEEDTEAQEHFATELEKIMDVLKIDSSDGLIGYYRYGDLIYMTQDLE